MGQKGTVIILGIILYLLSAGISYAAFSYARPGVGTQEVNGPSGNTGSPDGKPGKFTAPKNPYANLPKTEECPLNGKMHSKPERENWNSRRPLGVMVENSTAARPQSGLSLADVVYEAVAEGGITRFLAIYFCQDSEAIGPVRSARTYYLDWISEYGNSPLYSHVGGANTPGPADALGQIERYGWGSYNDMNQFSVGFPTFWRDYERLGKDVATEHTVYTSTKKSWDFAAKKRKLTNVELNDVTGKEVVWDEGFVKWSFKDDANLKERPAKASAEFNFSSTSSSYLSDYSVKWSYDHDSNAYLRNNGGKEHKDINTNQQVLAKNVVVLYMNMSIADDGYSEDGHGSHTLYANKGSGRAKFLVDGKVTDGTWAKKTRVDRTRFFDGSGAEMKLNRGLTWIEILPIGQQVTLAAK